MSATRCLISWSTKSCPVMCKNVATSSAVLSGLNGQQHLLRLIHPSNRNIHRGSVLLNQKQSAAHGFMKSVFSKRLTVNFNFEVHSFVHKIYSITIFSLILLIYFTSLSLLFVVNLIIKCSFSCF